MAPRRGAAAPVGAAAGEWRGSADRRVGTGIEVECTSREEEPLEGAMARAMDGDAIVVACRGDLRHGGVNERVRAEQQQRPLCRRWARVPPSRPSVGVGEQGNGVPTLWRRGTPQGAMRGTTGTHLAPSVRSPR